MQMPEFPNEREHLHQVRAALGAQFDFARRLFRFWLSQPKVRHLERAKVPELPSLLSIALDTQACRHFRSAFEQCYRAEALGANVSARTLFETVVALAFVLKPKVRILVRPEVNKATGAQLKDQNGNLKYRVLRPSPKNPGSVTDDLSRDRRAELYTLHSVQKNRRFAAFSARTKRLKRIGKRMLKNDVDLSVASVVGAEWEYILTGDTYSGLNIADLAELLDKHGLFFWYQTVFRRQSTVVHAGGAHDLLTVEPDQSLSSKFLSSEFDTSKALHAATAMLLCVIAAFHQYVGLGTSAATALHAFGTEFNQL